jgi:hypothetical protein
MLPLYTLVDLNAAAAETGYQKFFALVQSLWHSFKDKDIAGWQEWYSQLKEHT